MTNKTKLQGPYQEHVVLAKSQGRKPLTYPKWKQLARKNKKKQVVKIV
jgi:hypothetical protein